MKLSLLVPILLALLLGADLSLAGTRVEPVGSEFRINSYTTGAQAVPSVALDSDGDFVVVWTDYGDQDGDGYSVQGQRFASSGTRSGGEFQVNTYTTAKQLGQDIGMDSDGAFVVVWGSERSQVADVGAVLVQRFASNGVRAGGEFQIDPYTTGGQGWPAVGVSSDGAFVVAWLGPEVQGQRFASDGTALGGEFQINSYTTNLQFEVALGMESDGDFVAVWTDTMEIQGQRFASGGTRLGGEFQINSYTTGAQTRPAVAMDSDGDFAVVWEDFSGQDGDENGIQAQRFASSGTRLGGEFQVNSYTTDYQIRPAAAMDSEGNLVVLWEDFSGQHGTSSALEGQRFGSDGSLQGSAFQVGTHTTGYELFPAVGMSADGDFVVAWWETEQRFEFVGDVHGQRFEACPDLDDDGFTTCDGDCDDTDPLVNPGAAEIPGNGLDDDCDPATPPQTGCNPEPEGGR